ncbi:MAG: hypothetical protein V4619_01165 [Bacteroidota bacterium]
MLLTANGTFVPFSNINWFLVDFLFIWIGLEQGRFTKRDLRFGASFAIMWIGYCTLRSIFLTNLPSRYYVSDIVYLFKYILPSFLYCALLKDQAIHYLSKVIIDLTKISIPLYCLQLVAGPAIYAVGSALNIPPEVPVYHQTNFVVFTYVQEHAHQNSGFSWEPGAFGFFLIIGLMLHLFKNGFKMDSGTKWLIAGVLTTLSTTTYVAFSVVMLMYYRANGVKLSTLAIFAVPAAVVAMFQLPFLLDKVVEIYHHDMRDLQNIATLAAYYEKVGEQMPFNRFSSALFIYNQYHEKLILGVSNIFIESVPYLKNANTSSGILEYFAKFGIVAFVLLFTRMCQFYKKFGATGEQMFYCVLLVLILGFSESIFVLPMMTNFYFLYFYAKPDEVSEEEELEDNEYIEHQPVLQP